MTRPSSKGAKSIAWWVSRSDKPDGLAARCGSDFFEGSVAEPRRTFVTDLVADLCNKTRWLVTHHRYAWLVACPSLHTPMRAQTLSCFPLVPAEQMVAEHALAEQATCRGLATQLGIGTGAAIPRYTPCYVAIAYLVAELHSRAAWLALNSCNQAGAALWIASYTVLLILLLVNKCFPITDLRNKDLRYRPP